MLSFDMKKTIFYGIICSIVSILIGIVSRVSFISILFRSIVFFIVGSIITIIITYIINKFLMLDEKPSEKNTFHSQSIDNEQAQFAQLAQYKNYNTDDKDAKALYASFSPDNEDIQEQESADSNIVLDEGNSVGLKDTNIPVRDIDEHKNINEYSKTTEAFVDNMQANTLEKQAVNNNEDEFQEDILPLNNTFLRKQGKIIHDVNNTSFDQEIQKTKNIFKEDPTSVSGAVASWIENGNNKQ